VALWHERDISHSSTERVIFPDACIVLDFMLAETREIVEDLKVFPERMRQNLDSTGGLVYSQKVLLALVDAGIDRQDAYKLVQKYALESWDGGRPFREALMADPTIAARIDHASLDALFDPADQLIHVDEVFARLGLLATQADAEQVMEAVSI
jgi:adenylosuccinate lyase